jgi:hypothetical protein
MLLPMRHGYRISRNLLTCLLIFISFSAFSQVDYYWVGGTGQWEDYSHHWATTSGGTLFHTAKPHTGCNVIFDQNSFSAQNQIVIVGDPNIFCHDMSWGIVTH